MTGDGREVLAFYSIGNFVSNQVGLARRSSVIPAGSASRPAGRRQAGDGQRRLDPDPHGEGRQGAPVEAVDRLGKTGAAARKHLLRHLPAANLLPASTPFFAGMACRKGAAGLGCGAGMAYAGSGHYAAFSLPRRSVTPRA